LDPFNALFDEGHTALAPLSNAQAEQVMASLGCLTMAQRILTTLVSRKVTRCGDKFLID
jgi:hypothetical protein